MVHAVAVPLALEQSPEHLAEYAEKLAKPRVVDERGTNQAQADNGPEDLKARIAVGS